MQDRMRVAADPGFLHATGVDDDGAVVVIVQHTASQLRAQFTVEDPPFGKVYSKPYSIASIDPDHPGTHPAWDRYAGLGIGSAIYRVASELMPEIRWRAYALTDHSRAVRAKLHQESPFTWQTDCAWCNTRGVRWESAAPADFLGHPTSASRDTQDRMPTHGS